MLFLAQSAKLCFKNFGSYFKIPSKFGTFFSNVFIFNCEGRPPLSLPGFLLHQLETDLTKELDQNAKKSAKKRIIIKIFL